MLFQVIAVQAEKIAVIITIQPALLRVVIGLP